MRKKEECAKTKICLLFIFRHGLRGFHGFENLRTSRKGNQEKLCFPYEYIHPTRWINLSCGMNLSVSWDDFLGWQGNMPAVLNQLMVHLFFYLSTFTSSKQEQHNEEYF